MKEATKGKDKHVKRYFHNKRLFTLLAYLKNFCI